MKKLILMAVLFCFATAPIALAQEKVETPQVVTTNTAQEQKAVKASCTCGRVPEFHRGLPAD